MRERQIVRSGSGSFQSSPWKSQVNQTPAELLSVQSQSSSSQKWTRVACFKQNDVSRSELERRQFDMLISSWLTIIPISIMVWCNIAIMFWDCGLKHSSYKLYGKHATNSTLNCTAQRLFITSLKAKANGLWVIRSANTFDKMARDVETARAVDS